MALALRTADQLRGLINALGTREHPRGRVLSAYRQARRALKGALGTGNVTSAANLSVANDILRELRIGVEEAVRLNLAEAARVGGTHAARELALHGLPAVADAPVGLANAQQAVLAQYDAQAAQVRGALAAGSGAATLIGDGSRVGLLSPAPVVREAAGWLATAAVGGYVGSVRGAVERAGAPEAFVQQAVAAIDERTTNCCLIVHAQTQPFGSPFVLRGTPRYADQLERPGFHEYCRTTLALVRVEEARDALSQRMAGAARAELTARKATGERRGISPASATSRR